MNDDHCKGIDSESIKAAHKQVLVVKAVDIDRCHAW